MQRINERKQTYQLQSGTTIFNFKDTYEDNIAAWKLARLLGLGDLPPPSVGRTYQGQHASFTWIITDLQMDEAERMAKKIQPPEPEDWAKQINEMHVFDQLIYNWLQRHQPVYGQAVENLDDRSIAVLPDGQNPAGSQDAQPVRPDSAGQN